MILPLHNSETTLKTILMLCSHKTKITTIQTRSMVSLYRRMCKGVYINRFLRLSVLMTLTLYIIPYYYTYPNNFKKIKRIVNRKCNHISYQHQIEKSSILKYSIYKSKILIYRLIIINLAVYLMWLWHQLNIGE